MLFNLSKVLDETKVNYYIYKNFEENLSEKLLEEKLKINIHLKDKISYYDLNDLIYYDENDFTSRINVKDKKKF